MNMFRWAVSVALLFVLVGLAFFLDGSVVSVGGTLVAEPSRMSESLASLPEVPGARPLPSPDSISSHRLAVSDAVSKEAVSGAQVRWADFVGETSQDGMLSLAIGAREPGDQRRERVTVKASGYLPLEVSLPDVGEVGGIVRVELQRGVELSGSVALPDGTAGPAGVTVIAWPEDLARQPRDVTPAMLLLTKTTAQGQFTIDAVSADVDYVVMAGGAGAVTLEEVIARAPHESTVNLVASPVYALAVELVDGVTGELIDDNTPTFGHSPSWSMTDVACDSVFLGSLQRFLLNIDGLVPSVNGAVLPSRAVVQVVCAEEREGGVGPLVFAAHFVGYEENVTRLSVPRLTDEGVQVHTVSLMPTPGRVLFGELIVTVDDWVESGLADGGGPHQNGAVLHLHSDALPRSFIFHVDSGVSRLSVPPGRYRCRLAPYSEVGQDAKSDLAMRGEVVVPSLSTGYLELSAHRLGRIDLYVERNGVPYEGPTVLLVRRDGDVTYTAGRGYPVTLGGVFEGDLEVAVVKPFSEQVTEVTDDGEVRYQLRRFVVVSRSTSIASIDI